MKTITNSQFLDAVGNVCPNSLYDLALGPADSKEARPQPPSPLPLPLQMSEAWPAVFKSNLLDFPWTRCVPLVAKTSATVQDTWDTWTSLCPSTTRSSST